MKCWQLEKEEKETLILKNVQKHQTHETGLVYQPLHPHDAGRDPQHLHLKVGARRQHQFLVLATRNRVEELARKMVAEEPQALGHLALRLIPSLPGGKHGVRKLI